MKQISITNGEVLAKAEQLKKLSGSFPVKVAYKIVKNRRILTEAAQTITEAKNEIVLKYSKDGKIAPEDPHFTDATMDIFRLYSEGQTLTFESFSLDEIGEDSLDMATMDAIADFIKADEQEV